MSEPEIKEIISQMEMDELLQVTKDKYALLKNKSPVTGGT